MCLEIDFSQLIAYNEDGSVDRKNTKFEQIEDHVITFLNLAQSIQSMTDNRLKENFIESNAIHELKH